MAITENTIGPNVTGTGPHSFTFPYIKADDVKVTKTVADGTVTTLTKVDSSPGSTEYTQATTSITLGTALTATDKLRIYRVTSDSDLTATFYPGSAIRSADLNDNFTQNLYSTQEVVSRYLDTGGLGTMSGDLNLGKGVDITFEGATENDHETTLTVTDPTADRTITIPNETGTVVTTASTNVIDSDHYVDGSIDNVHLAADIIDGTKIANDVINSEHYAAGSIDLEHMSANSIDSDQYVDGSIDSEHIANDQIDSRHYAAGSIDLEHMSTNSVDSDQYVDGSIDLAHMSANSVDSDQYVDGSIDGVHIANDVVNSQHYAAASIDEEHIADSAVTTNKIAAGNVGSNALANNSVTIGKLGCEETTLTDSDSHVPTSGAVVDYVSSRIDPIGGFEAIATEVAFMATSDQPASGVIVSISDAAGVVVNGSGTSTTGRTTDGTPATVTINGFPTSLYNETLAAGVGLMVSSTGTGNVYNYHKILAAEGDVKQLSDDINDFNARYRVNAGEPSSNNDEGDLCFDTSANKMKVYDGSSWGEVTSSGDYKYLFLCPQGGTGAPTINGTIDTYDLREDSNSGSAASVDKAAQLLVSINGVIQKPNTGTDTPSEGFSLWDSNTIIFGANLPTGAEVFITQVGTATALNVPADSSVTEAKIASAAVTTAKIADDAVDGTKLANNIDIAGTLDVTSAATFDSTGTFVGNVQTGGDPNDGTDPGVKLLPTGLVQSARNSNSATSAVWMGYTEGTATATSRIDADGAATFVGTGTFNDDVTAKDASDVNYYSQLGYKGRIILKGGENSTFIEAYSTTSAEKFKVDTDGAATFAGNIQSGGNPIAAAANGTTILANSGIVATNDNTAVSLWRGYEKDNATPTSSITAAGAATFADKVTTGGFQSGTADKHGFEFRTTGEMLINSGRGTDPTFSIQNNGASTSAFITGAGKMQVGASGSTPYWGAATGAYMNGANGNIVACNSNGSDNLWSGFQNAGAQTSTITAAGAATFAGTIQSGGNPNSGTAAGTSINEYGTVRACQTSGSSTVFEGYTKDTTAATFTITAAGAGTFDGTVQAAIARVKDPNSDNPNEYIVATPDGTLNAVDNSGNSRWGITTAGAATFSDTVQSGGYPFQGTANGSALMSGSGCLASYETAASFLWRGYTTGTSTPTSSITAGGFAEFKQTVKTTPDVGGTGQEVGFRADYSDPASHTTYIGVRMSSVNYSYVHYDGSAKTSSITLDGDAMFSGSVKIGGTAAANEIDEYEEGTWTPAFSFKTNQSGSFTMSNVAGSYTKIGRLVTVTMMLSCTGIPTAGNSLVVTLPFTPADTLTTTTADNVGPCVAYYNATAGGAYAIVTDAGSGGGALIEQGIDAESGKGYDYMDAADITSTWSIRCTMSYVT